MQRVFSLRILFISAAILALIALPACGGGGTKANTTVTSILLTPTTVSLNQGGVAQLSAVALNSAGVAVAADLTFTSSNTTVAIVPADAFVPSGAATVTFPIITFADGTPTGVAISVNGPGQ